MPRLWSNRELRRFAPIFGGRVINVSAWRDEDKEGTKYQDYFTHADAYFISNYTGARGTTNRAGEIFLDLEGEIPKEYHKYFDVVFNHTTLEHIYDLRKAFANLCLLSRDVVILVVPFLQPGHHSKTYGDYWRFTPDALYKLFEENSFQILYESATPYNKTAVYLFVIAARNDSKWIGKIEAKRLDTLRLGESAIRNPWMLEVLQAWMRRLRQNV
ncbi:MAG: hypothetical protein OEV08_14370 [Nitrospira sp.]|nr:hypothetical protein [Nitrospira sp.]